MSYTHIYIYMYHEYTHSNPQKKRRAIWYTISVEIYLSIVGVATCAFWRKALSKRQFQKVQVSNQNILHKSKLKSHV
jgi:hypothetical protein